MIRVKEDFHLQRILLRTSNNATLQFLLYAFTFFFMNRNIRNFVMNGNFVSQHPFIRRCASFGNWYQDKWINKLIRWYKLGKQSNCLSLKPEWHEALKIHEVWGWIPFHPPPPSLFPFPKGQLEQNLIICKYVTNCLQNHNKIDDVTIGLSLYVILCFRDQSPLLYHFLFLERLLHVNLVKQNEFDKNYESFFTNFARPLFNKSVVMVR